MIGCIWKKAINMEDFEKIKIWIDFDNSPHVVLFNPIIKELQKQGYQIILTAKDHAQICDLADLLNLSYKRIGRHYGKNKVLKIIGVIFRALQLVPFAMREKPFIALNHGSRAQILLSKVLRMPSIGLNDYEHAKMLPLSNADWLIKPDIISENNFKINSKFILSFPGIKEDVYVPDFKSDSNLCSELGLNETKIIITIRPPATEAHYHNPESEQLFCEVINHFGQNQNISMVILPRNDKQACWIKSKWSDMCSNGKVIIPDRVIDGLNLLWHSDLVISGGGTMNREAAALGIPVYSIFRGKIGAVDQNLSDTGRLTLLESADDVRNKIVLKKWERPDKPENLNNITLKSIVNSIVDIYKKLEHTQR
jgi:predicted glycosyltransferase